MKKTIFSIRYALFGFVLLLLASCDKTEEPTFATFYFEPSTDIQDKVQSAMITMAAGDVIEFSAGTFDFTNTLTLINLDCITIQGAGRTETTLSFAGQVAGAEGLKLTNTNNVLLEKFTIQDTEGDAIKIKDSDGVTMFQVGAVWSGTASSDNGAYGLYPVQCQNVTIDECYAEGASDAGVYVGQSEYIHVRNTTAINNVAGIEIENCNFAEVYGNTATQNTGGILIFDLPNLTVKNGHQCKIYNNTLENNSHANFAPEGNIVAQVPAGTGIMLMTSKEVEVYGNTITNNNVMGIGIVNYPVLEVFDASLSYNDPDYSAYVANINIHDNTFSRTTTYPSEQNAIGNILQSLYPDGDMPDIVYDGLLNPDATGSDEEKICIRNNGSATFVNIDAGGGFQNISTDITVHDCQHTTLTDVTVAARDCE